MRNETEESRIGSTRSHINSLDRTQDEVQSAELPGISERLGEWGNIIVTMTETLTFC